MRDLSFEELDLVSGGSISISNSSISQSATGGGNISASNSTVSVTTHEHADVDISQSASNSSDVNQINLVNFAFS